MMAMQKKSERSPRSQKRLRLRQVNEMRQRAVDIDGTDVRIVWQKTCGLKQLQKE
jgi:hypothetical protein